MDYAGEQQMELEAVEAIYGDTLQEYDGQLPSNWNAVGKTYTMTVQPLEEGEEMDGACEEQLQMELMWAHTPLYPEEAPCLDLQSVYGLTNQEIARCMSMLQEEAQQNLGTAMIYTLVAAAKDWLRNRAAQTAVEDPDLVAKRLTKVEEDRRLAARAHGQSVNVATFAVWKAKFEAERAAAQPKISDGVLKAEEEKAKKLTGKQYFLLQGGNADIAAEADGQFEDDEEDFEDVEEGEEEMEGLSDDDEEGMLDELEAAKL
mmetsp:Transcript_21415/g.36528  ORF Transcript_21415/g.36528 Transcript_21415/m.36528 type:complete len:260 (-) Transcript_21415:480-1259(-)|eukprot:CAMPEP_0119106900 /NCGR_PEP_ID=MMETSP1180-20130426/7168_1 /TAXON_ID=3052 ORGANISM="Chlamydomonas cf sp, Strain CCMP681" /NCGR_SAMPLE_ID=MMETSP1180 /ASSEMBLY_ACC=CAM_ASM_000741 /LENGTH=259 /DNA_ID=CAMNT_0007092307 /DNA_START=107 /DNA_END=886 /DNA_ORIENTATION=+